MQRVASLARPSRSAAPGCRLRSARVASARSDSASPVSSCPSPSWISRAIRRCSPASASTNALPKVLRSVTSTANTSSAGRPPRSMERVHTSTSRTSPFLVRCRVSKGPAYSRPTPSAVVRGGKICGSAAEPSTETSRVSNSPRVQPYCRCAASFTSKKCRSCGSCTQIACGLPSKICAYRCSARSLSRAAASRSASSAVMMRLAAMSVAVNEKSVRRPGNSVNAPNIPKPNEKLTAVMVEIERAPRVETTSPRRMALTTMSRIENMTMTDRPTGVGLSAITAQQIATQRIHSAPSIQCSRNRVRLWRLMAINAGLTSSTPIMVLLHQRIHHTYRGVALDAPASRKPATPIVGATDMPITMAKRKIGTSRARPKSGSKPFFSRSHADRRAPAARPAPTPSEAMNACFIASSTVTPARNTGSHMRRPQR